jgi:hypothetical protein
VGREDGSGGRSLPSAGGGTNEEGKGGHQRAQVDGGEFIGESRSVAHRMVLKGR